MAMSKQAARRRAVRSLQARKAERMEFLARQMAQTPEEKQAVMAAARPRWERISGTHHGLSLDEATVATVWRNADNAHQWSVVAGSKTFDGVAPSMEEAMKRATSVLRREGGLRRRADADSEAATPTAGTADVEQAGGVTDEASSPQTTDDVESVGATSGVGDGDTEKDDVEKGQTPYDAPSVPESHVETEERATKPTYEPGNPIEPGFDKGSSKPNSDRAFAALRLARLRIQSGIAEADDDVILGQRIASSDLSDGDIALESRTLESVAAVTPDDSAARPATGRPQRQATRSTPSLSGMPTAAPMSKTSASDDEALFE